MKMVNGNFVTWLKINFKTTYFLLAFNLALGLVFLFLSFVKGNDLQPLLFLGAQVLPGTEAPYSVFILDVWRFLTAAFLHGSLLHLLFNMYALLSLGTFVERYYGGRKLFLTYIFTALGGAILSFIVSLLTLWKGGGGVANGLIISVGASGAVFGLVGLILGNRFLKRNPYEPELNVDINGLLWVVVVNMFLGFGLNALGGSSVINNWAHIGGLITGLVLGAFLNTSNAFDVSRFKKISEQVLFWISLSFFILAWIVNVFSMLLMATSFLVAVVQTFSS